MKMNEGDKTSDSTYVGGVSDIDESDEMDTVLDKHSYGNILENFPYLRHDGLGQIQQSEWKKATNIESDSTSSKPCIKKECNAKICTELSEDYTTGATKQKEATPMEVNTLSKSETLELQETPGSKSIIQKSKTQSKTDGLELSSDPSSHQSTEFKMETVNYDTTQLGSSEPTCHHRAPISQKSSFSIPTDPSSCTSNSNDKEENINSNMSKAVAQTSNTVTTRSKVQFLMKGKLGHDIDAMVKAVKQIMIEPVDVEEKLIENFVYNYPKEIKEEPAEQPVCNPSMSPNISESELPKVSTRVLFTQPSLSAFQKSTHLSCSTTITTNCTNTVTTSRAVVSDTVLVSGHVHPKPPVVRYTEPSIAEIRASFLGTSECSKNVSNLDADSEGEEKDIEERMSGTLEENLTNDDDNESEINEEMSDETWYGATLRKLTGIRNYRESNESTPTAKKGGRSDPENPFALTSPSFNDSTAKALMTTTQTSTATIVMISIMSIGGRDKLIPKIVNSKAAEGGLISIINPVEPPGNKYTQLNDENQISSERTSIMLKLRREKSKSSNDSVAAKTNIDRLDLNIKIDDNQFVGHGENKRWLCKLCPKSYTTKHNLVAHILDHSDIKPHLCLVCEKYFKQLSHLNTHMLTHDNVKPYVCTLCDKGFTQISHLKRHETVHMGSKPYICDICNRGFAFPSELRLHKDKHVSGSEKCPDCDKKFETWNQLQEHMVVFGHLGDLQCKQCDRIFRFPSQLRDHMMSHAGSRPYICTECGMNFMKEHHLKSHQFTHTGLRPYVCPDCGRSFNQKANMQRHMLIHKAERSYKCEVCSKTFTQPQTLKAHMVVHSDTKPYKCNICGKQFGRQHNLQGHMHIHSDSKPYTCSICQSSFTLKGNLNRHKKVKHGLDESTEIMEEDAVNFLSTISDRAHENYYVTSDTEMDPDLQESLASFDSRSSRKGRKSTPRKRSSRQLYDDIGDGGSDIETETCITYSDEERENDRTSEISSKYFDSSEKRGKSSSRKRKIVPIYQVEVDDDFNVIEDIAITAKEIKDVHKVETDNIKNTTSNETRSTRKRKKKYYGDDFTETGLDSETSVRSQRKQSAKLDKIIASKFKT